MLKLQYSLPAEMEYLLSYRLIPGESRRRAAGGELKNRRRVKHGIAAEERHSAYLLRSPANLGISIKEVPERRPVDNGVIHGAPDEDGVGHLRHLHSQQRLGMPGVAESVVQLKELTEARRNVGVGGREKNGGGEMGGFCMYKVNAFGV
ncbi:unnamed protein product [Cuscuta epithymum]|uniref:Uncharacterized protein n=1 Tax=Cuscuta epithymum TaxID=186058 RepID=A0AAV0F591_9ASTE|nr:unnamed protein product [Cuscuta epithymum]